MHIGLVSYRCENRNISFNLGQIEKAMKETSGKADLLCFGEAFLQGFDSFVWEYEKDKEMAVGQSSEVMRKLGEWTVKYGIALLLGYLEKDGDKLYSSCVVISRGKIIHNYRRISKGWKEYSRTGEHYCEGDDTSSFRFMGKNIKIGLCGDLWDYPERFKTDDLLIWPLYVNFSLKDWLSELLREYDEHAGTIAKEVLIVNPLDDDPVSHGGAFHVQNGKIKESIPFDREDILIVEI